jgi:hypothetical protein
VAKRNWVDGVLGNTPLTAARLNDLESDVEASLLQLARDPSQLFRGTITRTAEGAPLSATVEWPDGAIGVYSGTVSTTFLTAVDAYTVTRPGTPARTFTQPAVTRDANGYITNRPPITITEGA